MSLKIILLMLLCVSVFNTEAQSLSKKETDNLFTTVKNILSKSDDKKRQHVPSEFFFITLEMDFASKVKDIHILGDAKNADSGYYALSRLTPSDFKNWIVADCKNTTIVVPVIFGGNQRNYVEFVFSDIFWKPQNDSHILKQSGRTIVTNILVHDKEIITY